MKHKIKKGTYGTIIIALLLLIGLGYAYFSTDLSAHGTAKLLSATQLREYRDFSSEDFHFSTYRINIVKVSFVDYIDLSKAIKLTNGTGANYWDLSANKNGRIIGWLEPDSLDKTKYHLYIGADSTVVYANVNSSYLLHKLIGLKEINFSNFNTSKVTDMSSMFGSCESLTNLDVSNFDTSKVTDMSSMFGSCESLTSLDLRKFDTSKVTDMNSMFSGCTSITSIDISRFDTSEVTDMSQMFSSCTSLTTLDLNNFNTSKVTDMSSMFGSCESLTNLDVSNFDTSKVTDMSSMFSNCSSLTSVDVSNFNTSKVTDMGYMFGNCSNLNSIDLSSFNTTQLTNMNYMFNNCSKLSTLDLSSFYMSNVTDKVAMLMDTNNVVRAYARSAWDASLLNNDTNKPTSYTFVVK